MKLTEKRSITKAWSGENKFPCGGSGFPSLSFEGAGVFLFLNTILNTKYIRTILIITELHPLPRWSCCCCCAAGGIFEFNFLVSSLTTCKVTRQFSEIPTPVLSDLRPLLPRLQNLHSSFCKCLEQLFRPIHHQFFKLFS